jgi:hypothetical protein
MEFLSPTANSQQNLLPVSGIPVSGISFDAARQQVRNSSTSAQHTIHHGAAGQQQRSSTQPIGRISSASPHLAATKTGQEAGECPGKASPQPPPPPAGPNGATGGAKQEPANGTPPAKAREPESESQFRPEDSACSLFPQLGRQAWCISSLQACPRWSWQLHQMWFVARSGVPPATYIRGNGGACQDFLLLSPVLKRPLPMRK